MARQKKNSNPPPHRTASGRWSGKIDFRGSQHWVGTFDTPEQWKLAAAELIVRLSEEEERRKNGFLAPDLTLREFVEAGWPDTHAQRRPKESGRYTLRTSIKRAVNEFGNRQLRGGISRPEARTWANRPEVAISNVNAVRALFNDAIDDGLAEVNPFSALRLPVKLGRKDIDVLTFDELALLCQIPLQIWQDDYGKIMKALVRWQAETGMRPGETVALTRHDIDVERSLIYCRYQRSSSGLDTTPKVDTNAIVLPPRARDEYLAMPKLHPTWAFTNQRGNKLQKGVVNWYWQQIRAAFLASLPDDHWLRRRSRSFDLYELRHFAATWLGEDPPNGLGLSPRDIAHQLGHKDGGVRVMRLYGHPDQRATRRRIQEAFERDYQDKNGGCGTDEVAAEQSRGDPDADADVENGEGGEEASGSVS